MEKNKLIIYLWGCVTVVFVSLYFASAVLNTVKIWHLTDGATISLDLAGIGEMVLVVATYFIVKIILTGKSTNDD